MFRFMTQFRTVALALGLGVATTAGPTMAASKPKPAKRTAQARVQSQTSFSRAPARTLQAARIAPAARVQPRLSLQSGAGRTLAVKPLSPVGGGGATTSKSWTHSYDPSGHYGPLRSQPRPKEDYNVAAQLQAGQSLGGALTQGSAGTSALQQPIRLSTAAPVSTRLPGNALLPKDLARNELLQTVKDPSAGVRATMGIPEYNRTPTTGAGGQTPGATNFAELIRQSQGRQDPADLTPAVTNDLAGAVATQLGDLGYTDPRFKPTGTPGLPLGQGSGASDELSDLAEASLYVPGLPAGPSLTDYTRGSDPRTSNIIDDIINIIDDIVSSIRDFFTGEDTLYDENGIRVFENSDGEADLQLHSGARETYVKVKNKTHWKVGVRDNAGNDVLIQGDGKKVTITPLGKPWIINPNPLDDAPVRGPVTEADRQRLEAKLNAAKDPADENGPVEHDMDRLVRVVVGHIMSTVNPVQNAAAGAAGGKLSANGPLDGGRVELSPLDPVNPGPRGKAGPKGPKPDVNPVGPIPRAAAELSGQGGKVVASGAANRLSTDETGAAPDSATRGPSQPR